MEDYSNIGELIKKKRREKGYSTRELAKLCDISHTEISNIEKGQRVRPAVLTLKAFERYLDLDFKELARAVGYSEETIEYGDENIIVTYERYDKKITEYEDKIKELNNIITIKSHLAVDIKDYLDSVYEYLKNQKSVDEEIVKKVEFIYKILDNLKRN